MLRLLLICIRSLTTSAVLSCCLLLAGCSETDAPEGVVATVNDEPIYLRTLQALLDGRSAALGTLPRLSLEAMKSQYGEALAILIVQTLVRQELQRLHIPVNNAALDKALADIREDYGGDALSRLLVDESLDETDWRVLMRDYLSMVSFEKRVLLPGIRIQLSMVRDYYNEHRAQFQLPAMINVCFVAGEQRESLDAFCSVFPDGTKAHSGATAQCLDVTADELPQLWREETQKLVPGACVPPRQEGGAWRSVCLAERRAARTLEISSAYPLIERILLEQEKITAFDRWLESRLARSTVKISPNIREGLLTASSRPKPRQPVHDPAEEEDIRPDGANIPVQEKGNGAGAQRDRQ
jgi:hypothetical protein